MGCGWDVCIDVRGPLPQRITNACPTVGIVVAGVRFILLSRIGPLPSRAGIRNSRAEIVSSGVVIRVEAGSENDHDRKANPRLPAQIDLETSGLLRVRETSEAESACYIPPSNPAILRNPGSAPASLRPGPVTSMRLSVVAEQIWLLTCRGPGTSAISRFVLLAIINSGAPHWSFDLVLSLCSCRCLPLHIALCGARHHRFEDHLARSMSGTGGDGDHATCVGSAVNNFTPGRRSVQPHLQPGRGGRKIGFDAPAI
jgi:hypothetical protein